MEQHREIIRRLMIAVNKIDGLYYLAARKSGMKYNTLALLYALADGGRHSQKQICEDWLIPRTTINTVVAECAAAGYVTLTAMGNREKAVSLTESGKAYAESVLGGLMQAEQAAMLKTSPCPEAFVADLERFTECLGAELSLLLGAEDKGARK